MHNTSLHAASALLAIATGVLVCFVTFGLLPLVVPYIGGFNPLTLILLAAPMGLFGPWAIRLFRKEQFVGLLWIAALFPIVSLAANTASFLLFVWIANRQGGVAGRGDVLFWIYIASNALFWALIASRLAKTRWIRGEDAPEHKAPTKAIFSTPEDPTDIPDSERGRCPSCEEAIRLSAVNCWRCGALFGSGAAWQVKPESSNDA